LIGNPNIWHINSTPLLTLMIKRKSMKNI